MGRFGTGHVKLNGKTMTKEDYRNAVINSLKHNGNNWMTVNQMIIWASENKMVEKKNAPRKGAAHPLYKIVSNMMDENNVLERKSNASGRFVYRLKNAQKIFINGQPYERLHDGSYDEVVF